MTDRELMQQALEALEQSETTVPYEGFGMAHREAERKHQASITALRERLAQPEQEPATKAGELRAMKDEFWKQPEQEPVAKWDASAPLVVHPHPAFQAAPPQRKPLSDEDMKLLWAKHGYKSAMCKPFARAIEAAHGIKGEA